MSSIGKNVSRYRKRREMIQKKLAEKANIDVFTLSKIETGTTPNPTIETLTKIAKALGVGVEDLIK